MKKLSMQRHGYPTQATTCRYADKMLGIALLVLSPLSANAGIITLVCGENDEFTFHVEIDEARNEVHVNGVSATSVFIDNNRVIFDLEMGDATYLHVLSRLSGTVVAQNKADKVWTSPFACKRASPQF